PRTTPTTTYIFQPFPTRRSSDLPKDMADNLKDYGSFIPGYRPGKRTADYLERVLMRITFVGAAFLAIVAIIPSVITSSLEVNYLDRKSTRLNSSHEWISYSVFFF